MNFIIVLVLVIGLQTQSLQAAAVANFQCYVCFPDGPNLQKCNEPRDSQLVPCAARPDGSQVCWMTMKEDRDKSLIVTRGCGRAMEAPELRNDACKKTRDKATGTTEQICNCNTSKCNKNNCRSKSSCFL